MASETSAPDGPRRGIFIDLDYFGVAAHQLAYDAARKALAAVGVDLSPLMYSRHFMGMRTTRAVHELLRDAGKQADEAKVVAAIDTGLAAAVAAESVKMTKPALKLIKKAQSEDLVVGFVSGLGAENTEAILTRSGLEELKDCTVCFERKPTGTVVPDAWTRLARTLTVPLERSMAFTASKETTAAALAAGMRCAVVPDSFSGFQDFGGADYVVDEVSDELLNDAVAHLKTL